METRDPEQQDAAKDPLKYTLQSIETHYSSLQYYNGEIATSRYTRLAKTIDSNFAALLASAPPGSSL